MRFQAYILKCSDGSYYTGHTDNMEQRLSQHHSGKIDSYTATRLPVKLVWAQNFHSRDAAFRAERKIKGWSRKKMEALIAGDWDTIIKLSSGIKN